MAPGMKKWFQGGEMIPGKEAAHFHFIVENVSRPFEMECLWSNNSNASFFTSQTPGSHSDAPGEADYEFFRKPNIAAKATPNLH